MSNVLHARLRTHTAAAHAALDARFTGGLGDARRYAVYLLGMHRLVSAFEAATPDTVTVACDRGRLLRADLDALALPPLPPARLAFDSEVDWLGGLYVIEGSALGARVLLRDLQARHASATTFLRAHADEPARWRATLAWLESRAPGDLPAMAVGATRTFALADASFALAEQRDRP